MFLERRKIYHLPTQENYIGEAYLMAWKGFGFHIVKFQSDVCERAGRENRRHNIDNVPAVARLFDWIFDCFCRSASRQLQVFTNKYESLLLRRKKKDGAPRVDTSVIPPAVCGHVLWLDSQSRGSKGTLTTMAMAAIHRGPFLLNVVRIDCPILCLAHGRSWVNMNYYSS